MNFNPLRCRGDVPQGARVRIFTRTDENTIRTRNNPRKERASMRFEERAFEAARDRVHVIREHQGLIRSNGFAHNDRLCSTEKWIVEMNDVKSLETVEKRRNDTGVTHMNG